MRTDETLTTRQLVARAGVTYRQADYWTRLGYLHADGDGTPGSGYRRRYPPVEARVAHALGQVIHTHVAPGVAMNLAELVRRLDPADGGPVVVDDRGRLAVDLRHARWVVQLLPLADCLAAA